MRRTGDWSGHPPPRVAPDAVAVGRVLEDGDPVSAVALSAATAARLEATGLPYAQFSLQNDPLTCAAAIEVIAAMKEDRLVEPSARVGERLLSGLRALATVPDGIDEVHGRGLRIGVTLAEGIPVEAVYRSLLDRWGRIGG